MKWSWVLASLLGSILCVVAGTAVGDLVSNGDFSLGNTGFGSDYQYAATNASSETSFRRIPAKAGWSQWKITVPTEEREPDEGKYSVTATPQVWHPKFVTPYSAELPVGNSMLVVNGSDDISHGVWYQDILVAADTTYDVSFSAASLFPDNPSQLQFFAGVDPSNRFAMQQVVTIELTGATGPDAWMTGTGQFTAHGTGIVRVFITNMVTAATGNDFAIDDIRVIQAVPEPSSLALLGIGSAIAAGAWVRRRKTKRRAGEA